VSSLRSAPFIARPSWPGDFFAVSDCLHIGARLVGRASGSQTLLFGGASLPRDQCARSHFCVPRVGGMSWDMAKETQGWGLSY